MPVKQGHNYLLRMGSFESLSLNPIYPISPQDLSILLHVSTLKQDPSLHFFCHGLFSTLNSFYQNLCFNISWCYFYFSPGSPNCGLIPSLPQKEIFKNKSEYLVLLLQETCHDLWFKVQTHQRSVKGCPQTHPNTFNQAFPQYPQTKLHFPDPVLIDCELPSFAHVLSVLSVLLFFIILDTVVIPSLEHFSIFIMDNDTTIYLCASINYLSTMFGM